jgi:hypothetical protein
MTSTVIVSDFIGEADATSQHPLMLLYHPPTIESSHQPNLLPEELLCTSQVLCFLTHAI